MKLSISLLMAVACISTTVSAQVPPVTPAVTAAPSIPAIFLKPVLLRGTLGDVNVQVHIRPKEQIEEGIEGEYFIFGNSLKILLAGEIEGDILFMEESENGTNISGQWDGKLEGNTLAGTWMSADGTFTKPFSLQVVHVKSPASAVKPGKNAAAKAVQP